MATLDPPPSPGPRRGDTFYPYCSRVPAISSVLLGAPGARRPPQQAGWGSRASSRAAVAAAAATTTLGRRPPSPLRPPPPPPRSSRDPPARAPHRGQHGDRDVPASGSPGRNLRVFASQSRGSTMTPPQHHTVISAAAEEKKRQSLRKEGGVGASGAEADTPGEQWEGPGQKGR